MFLAVELSLSFLWFLNGRKIIEELALFALHGWRFDEYIFKVLLNFKPSTPTTYHFRGTFSKKKQPFGLLYPREVFLPIVRFFSI